MNSGDLVDIVVVVCGHGDLLVVVGDLVDLLVVVGNLVGLVVFVISAFLGKSSSSSSSELSSDMSWQEDGSGWMVFPRFVWGFLEMLLREPVLGTNRGL